MPALFVEKKKFILRSRLFSNPGGRRRDGTPTRVRAQNNIRAHVKVFTVFIISETLYPVAYVKRVNDSDDPIPSI